MEHGDNICERGGIHSAGRSPLQRAATGHAEKRSDPDREGEDCLRRRRRTAEQRSAQTKCGNHTAAGRQTKKRTAGQEESGGTEAFGFLLFFLLPRFACQQGAGYYILDKNIAWIL